MKIFHVVTVSEYGGVQSVIANLTKALSKENDIYILSGGEGEAWESLDGNVTKIRLCEHRKHLSWKDAFLLVKLFYYRFKYKPDIIHLHSSKMGALGRIAFNPRRIVYTMHGFDSLRLGFRKFLFVERWLKNRHAIIIGVSRHDVSVMKEEGINKNITYIHNGITDYPACNAGQEEGEISFRLCEIKKHYSKIVMCIARISKQKKFDLFLETAIHLPEYAFVWIGNKEEMKSLPKNVFCLGETSFAHIYLKYADLFILPTNYEGLPVSILEAISYGIPVVASDVGGVSEIIKDGYNGFCVENNVRDFTEKINKVFIDEKFYKEMSVNARKSFEENFTIGKMVNKYREIYENIYNAAKN